LEELSQPSQTPGDTRQPDVVGPSDQGHANERLCYAQGSIESVQGICPDYASGTCQSHSLGVEVEDGNLSNFTRIIAISQTHQHLTRNLIITKSLIRSLEGIRKILLFPRIMISIHNRSQVMAGNSQP
jgi:hypothetical protein